MTDFDSSVRLRALSSHNVTLPEHLEVKCTKQNLFSEASKTWGYDGVQLFGTAFIQGKRLQFSTAMPISTMLKISKVDRAKAGAGVTDVREHANRPRIAGHGRALRDYFLKTACMDEKFILPAFAFNFGDESTTPEDVPDALLLIYASENENASNGWPALFQLPNAIQLDTTDGAHRESEIDGILNDKGVPEAQRLNLSRNACDVKIIFERKRIDAHQDFADCAKAKPITRSLISTFDVRDLRNNRAVELVQKVPFLEYYVDATAANVNLSAKSVKAWSMSSVRSFVGHVQDHYPPAREATEGQVEATLEEKLEGAEDFFAALIRHIPQLKTLEAARVEAEARKVSPSSTPPVRTETAATFRGKRGGDIALRGIGMSLFARAFVHAKDEGLTYDHIASRLALVDWHLLDCERDELPNPELDEGRVTFAAAVRQHLNPLWSGMIIIGESRYRIGSSNDEANEAWGRIIAKHFNDDDDVPVAAE